MCHQYRYTNYAVDYACLFCESDIETEVHFILVCPKYAEIIEQYVPKKHFSSPSSFKLLATTNKVLLLHLATYIMKVFIIWNA